MEGVDIEPARCEGGFGGRFWSVVLEGGLESGLEHDLEYGWQE